MKKYYLVPVTTPAVYIRGKSLLELLGIADKELYDREINRRKLTYENEHSKILLKSGYIRNYNEVTSSLYKMKSIPERIVLEADDNGVREFVTHESVNCTNDSYLEIFKVESSVVMKYLLNNGDYESKLLNLMKKNKIKEKRFFKFKRDNKHNN